MQSSRAQMYIGGEWVPSRSEQFEEVINPATEQPFALAPVGTVRDVEQAIAAAREAFDLDPGAGVSWAQLVEGAELTHVLLTELGLDSWLKTSGGKGLHVVVPITPRLDFHAVKAFSQALARHLAQVIPSKFTAVMGEKNRVGKIFIDYLRNGPAQTTACAYSARARPGLGVSMPVAWEQLRDLHGSAQWTIATAPAYLRSASQDPWRDFWTKKQSIARAMRQLG